ncbi:uncharacterized protein G2W53_007652 [Senna tora]|uniref:Uncharacterized protein n=1 Tax=Senna tora TaxID=362788 RepID=A0A834X731_9FABA|nr:uncharacterized protein G2W53_007652 [Senna tora]
MTSKSFHVIMNPIRALKPLGFTNTTQSDRFDSVVQQHVDFYFLKPLEIQSRFLVQNMLRLDFTLLPFDHESHSSIKSTLIAKYNTKRSVSLTSSTTHLTCTS